MPEEVPSFRTLWILEYYNGVYHSLQSFYALSEEDAEQQVREWSERQAPGKVIRKSLRAFPGGFKIGMTELPGRIPVSPD